MRNYSAIIASTMEYVDNRIMELHPKSVNREMLHRRMNRELCIRIEELCLLSSDDFKRMIDNIFIRQLIKLIEEQRKSNNDDCKSAR